MTIIGQTTDRWGRVVVLTEAGWRHIIDGHPDLFGQEAEIFATVARPDRVNFAARHVDRESFYRARSERSADRASYLKVCVEYESADGTIVTAYPTDRIKRREQNKWP